MSQTPAPISWPARLSQLAGEEPDRAAIVFAPVEGSERTLTYGELDRASNRAARLLAACGIDAASTVVLGLPNRPEHFVGTWAAWKLGGLVLPLAARMPERERNDILEVAGATLAICEWEACPAPVVTTAELVAEAYSDAPLPDVVPHPGKAVGSGGSTGRPKVIIDPNPLLVVPGRPHELMATVGFRPGQVQLIPGPLFHNSPFSWSNQGLLHGQTIVLMERFDARHFVDLVQRHRVRFVLVVPTMMRRILELPGLTPRDLGSLESTVHTAAICPSAVKRAWMDLLGPEKVWEAFGATEAVGHHLIRGDEWLQHPGSVGRPWRCEQRIVGEDGRELRPGEVGEIYTKPLHSEGRPTFEYRGASPHATPDGFFTVGDLGWVDEHGYLYVADRRLDMIVQGGANVYPAEVEGALLEHPGVADVAVIGLSDADLGRRVHAVIQPRDPIHPPSEEDLRTHCRERLQGEKVPRSFEFVSDLPRNDMDKLRRSRLLAEREGALPGSSSAPRRDLGPASP